MKDFKSMVIGFLMATCIFLFMGNTSSNEMYVTTNDNGKYQAYSHNDKNYMINTTNGALYFLYEDSSMFPHDHVWIPAMNFEALPDFDYNRSMQEILKQEYIERQKNGEYKEK